MRKKKKNDMINIGKYSIKKTILLNILVLLLIVSLIFILIYNFKLTNLERVKIEEINKRTENYMEDYVDSDDDGKYIIYAIDYLSNVNNQNEISVKEVLDVINDTFNEEIDEKKLYSIGITNKMLEKGIVLDDKNKKYIISNVRTRQDIAEEKIIKYELINISKKSRNKFVLTYKKYVIDDPYQMLNYYNNSDSKTYDEKISKTIISYLKGESDVYSVKSIINKDNIDKFGKEDGKREITLIVNSNDKLTIEKIK